MSRYFISRFNLIDNRSGVKFKTDLHVMAEVLLDGAERYEPYRAHITMDIGT